MGPEDQLIVADGDELLVYAYYVTRGRVYSLHQAVGPDGRGVPQWIDEVIAQARSRGGQVYLHGLEPGRGVRWDVLEAAGLGNSLFDAYVLELAWTVAGERVFEVVPRPR